MSWEIQFYAETSGAQPVREWLEGLPKNVQHKVAARIEALAEHGASLDFPYTSQIEGRMRELRLRVGKTRYRVLYFFDERRVGVLLHGFTKDTDAVEESDKAAGRSRMAAHNERLTRQERKHRRRGE